MSGVKVKKTQFSAASKVYDAGDDGLASVIRKLAQDNARTRIVNATDFTDNSTGSAVWPAVMSAQTGKEAAAFTETGTASAPKAGFDTAIGKFKNAFSVIAEHLNKINGSIGLPLIVDDTGGTIATEGTIPALDKTLTAVNANCLDVTTGRARLETLKNNVQILAHAANRISVAVGHDKITVTALGGSDGDLTLGNLAATGTATDGTAGSTIADTVVDAALTAAANNIATIADHINQIFGAQPSDMTDSTGGTASASEKLVAMPAPEAADGAATTSSPKAGFDTQLAAIEDGLSELTARTNALLKRNGVSTTALTDSTGVTPNGTLPAVSATLTAVDGSTGTVAVDVTTATARINTIRDAVSSIAAKVNLLTPIYGQDDLVDEVEGTVSNTIANIAATGTGVSGAGSTMLDSEVDTWLGLCRNNLATLANKLNEMTSTNNLTEAPLQVVAWDN